MPWKFKKLGTAAQEWKNKGDQTDRTKLHAGKKITNAYTLCVRVGWKCTYFSK